MKIIARCHPALEPILPTPVPAARALPHWLRTMPAEVAAPTLSGMTVRTLKHCLPFIDALSLGLMIPLATDLTVEGGEIAWDWDPPVIADAPLTRAPVGLHVPEQATGAPLPVDGQLMVKFINFWALEAPEGWDLLFTHPLNRADLPFRTLSGLVSADRFRLGYVHFPALWTDPGFEGVLPAGTPVAQVIALPCSQPGLEIATMSEAVIAESRHIQETLQAEPGHYRKSYRA
ncbi:hypothetical protein [Defluviimonas salinarum]|uniref:Uncharacterized protein n=1 Tax=Defluviimonas salinarum TaxID=2992147 RepID=A0ABT3J6M2_9RHOB|nr:hypothetical protein [Defluviimonas salinarum]MCW3783308.1 hypothetical protein [Defluviimonas salinarum]